MMALTGLVALQMQAETVADTLVIEGVDKVKIETMDTLQRIVISGSKDDPQLHYVQRITIPDSSAVRRKLTNVKDFNKVVIKRKDGKPSKWESTMHLYAGVNTLTSATDDYDVKLWPSLEIGIGPTWDFYPYGKHNVWRAGIGVAWATFRFDKDYFWKKYTKDVIKLDKGFQLQEKSSTNPSSSSSSDYPPYSTCEHLSTSMNIFRIQVPLVYTHNFDERGRWSVSVGAMVNFNLQASCDYAYKNDDEKYEVSISHIGQRPVTVDALAVVKIPKLPGLYCKYSPMTVFKDNRAPKMRQLSFGIMF